MPDPNNSSVQANNNSVGNLSVGGSVEGSITIGNNNIVGFTSAQVSTLITQISTTFQVKPFDGRCPYKGLETFQEKDADQFFGREKLVDNLIGRVKESKVIFVTGSSGSGKSSLVRAGLIPKLRKMELSENWLYAIMKPGRDPFAALATAFSRMKNPSLGKYFSESAGQSSALQDCAESALTDNEDQRMVLFIDQFEEIFTQLSRDKTDAFINLLAYAATVEKGRIILLTSMRSDFIPHCQTYPKLNALLGGKYAFAPIGAMQPDELVSAIAQPAMRVGLKIDPELISQIINDMQGEPGALPLMQFALKDLFDALQAAGGVIDLRKEGYIQRGGIHKALERHANDSFNKLGEREQELARSIFSGLIEVGDGSQYTRRIAKLDELIPDNAESEEVELIIRKLADARLVTTDNVDEKITVTISHEKLISAWGWLKKLVDENRDVIAMKNEIINDAAEWGQNQRDDSFLYRGARLANAREKLQAKQLTLSGLAMEFMEAAEKSYADALEQEKKRTDHLQKITNNAIARQLAAQAQNIMATRSSKAMTAILLATQSMKILPSREAAQILLNNHASIQQTTDYGIVESVILSSDGKYVATCNPSKNIYIHEVATGTEIACLALPPTLSESDSAHLNLNRSVVFSSDNQYLLLIDKTYTRDYTASVYEIVTGEQIAHIEHAQPLGSLETVAFSPDGKYLVQGGYLDRNNIDGMQGNELNVFDVQTNNRISTFTGHGYDNVARFRAAFSLDGQYVASGASDKTVRVWGAITGEEIACFTQDNMAKFVTFSPDGKHVVSGDYDRTVQAWDITTGEEIIRMTNHARNAFNDNVAFSRDSQFVALAGDDNAVHVWEINVGKEIARLRHDDRVYSIAFSLDGKHVASGSRDKTARVWEIETGKEIARMTHEDVVSSVIFSSDGITLVSCGDTTARLWKMAMGGGIARMPHGNAVHSVTVSPNGKFVLSRSTDYVAHIWEAATGNEIAKIYMVASACFSPDSTCVASVTVHPTEDSTRYSREKYDYTIDIREITTGREMHSITPDQSNLTDYLGNVKSIVFSPNSTYLAVGGGGIFTSIWNATNGELIAYMNDSNHKLIEQVRPVSFSRDGKYVLGLPTDFDSFEYAVRLWDAVTGTEIARMNHEAKVLSTAFSPDGKYITSIMDKTIRLWEAITGTEIARMNHESKVLSIAFSPDGKYLASGSVDETARVWEVVTGKEIACLVHDDEVHSVAFNPNGRVVISGSKDKTARVWEASTGTEIVRMTHDDEVNSVTFNQDGKFVVSGSKDKTAQIWKWQSDDLIANVCNFMPRNLTRAEWQQYIGDVLPYQAVCEDLPIEPEPTATP